jgi:hypothetical protein
MHQKTPRDPATDAKARKSVIRLRHARRASDRERDWITKVEARVPRLMKEAAVDVPAFKVYDLDQTNPKHWQILLMLTSLLAETFGRDRGRPRRKTWTPDLLGLIGASIDALKHRYPDASDAKIAELLKEENPTVFRATAESLRKRFPEARRAWREALQKRGSLRRRSGLSK